MKTAVLLLAAFAVAAAPALACPNCKDAGEGATQKGGNQPGKGYFWSILTMLGTMGLVLAGMIRLLVKASKGVAQMPPETPEAASPEAGPTSP